LSVTIEMPVGLNELEMFDELITSLIRKELTNHFTSYTPEELLLLTDLQFMKLVDDDVLYNKKNYITEDKKQ